MFQQDNTSMISSSDISLIAKTSELSQHKIVSRLPVTYTDDEKNLIYNQDRDSPLPKVIQSYWMNTFETKFIILDGTNEFSIYLMPHILKA